MQKTISKIKELPKILIVDDRETERAVLSKLLSRFKAEIYTAGSGQEALSQLIRHDFILVLLDVQMPMMDGLETARLMRSNFHTANIPIIFLTAYDKDEINMLQGYKVGAIDYLFKPFNEEILLSKVDTFLRSYSFEKDKEYEKILDELEAKNQKLRRAQQEAFRMMEDANKAKRLAETSQKQVESQAKELLRYTKELEQFAYVATHDLRAPIINLNGLLSVFERRGLINSENKIIIDKVFSSVHRINETLNNLIEVVAYKKNPQLEARPIDLELFVSDIVKDLEEQITRSGALVQYDFRKASKIEYIPGHLRSILQNLLTNAIKYSSPDRRPEIKISARKPPDPEIAMQLSVEDNGIGIENNQEEKVFGLFQRLTTDIEGKGMGLYIIKSQIESMGGRIEFTSKPGKGTVFNVFLKNLSFN